jgi:hypothetical protein
VVGLASGAPGGDLLFHEACAELGIASTMCLPVPADAYARSAFRRQDAWRTRFLDLRERGRPVLELSDRRSAGWLQRPPVDVWERGNRWVLQLALTGDAREVTLLALWDGKTQGDGAGGTAHMVKLARESGRVDLARHPDAELRGGRAGASWSRRTGRDAGRGAAARAGAGGPPRACGHRPPPHASSAPPGPARRYAPPVTRRRRRRSPRRRWRRVRTAAAG